MAGAELNSCLGAAGKSSALYVEDGMFSFLKVGSDLVIVGEAERPRALPIISWAFAE